MLRSIFTCIFPFVLNLSLGYTQGLFMVEKMPTNINSSYDEISPVPSRDGKTLYFTRVAYPDFNRILLLDSTDQSGEKPAAYLNILADAYSQIAGYPVSNPVSTGFNQDVWIADISDSTQAPRITHPGYPLNNALPNSLVAITPDPNAFYIINQFKINGDMERGFSLIRQKQDTLWDFPEPVTIKDYYTITSDVSLTMSFDGKILILSATRFDSKGMDLYVCFKTGNNQWSAPSHMGSTINSDKRETTPFLSEDHTTLFFSSNRWNTTGGNDIFMSKRLDETWTNWSEPIRLTEPINSKYDESQPYFNMTSGYLYFTSKRDGSSDIYRVKIAPPQPTEIIVNGRILNSKTKELVTNAQVQYGSEGNPVNAITATDGYFSIKIPKGIRVDLTAAKDGFQGITSPIEFRRDYYFFRDQEIELLIEPLEPGQTPTTPAIQIQAPPVQTQALPTPPKPASVFDEPLVINKTIELKAIYFQQSKAIILPASYDELGRLSTLLQGNPNLHIRIEGHTDNQGNKEELIKLSRARAEAVKKYLTDKGSTSERIETAGFGPDYPISTGSEEAERALNRRVEIRILKL
ncbi:MAG: OmpA family protein [Saprospiraceae bacterium]|nr:OmpA family protein [Saprospiraceae bacterium]